MVKQDCKKTKLQFKNRKKTNFCTFLRVEKRSRILCKLLRLMMKIKVALATIQKNRG
jgi:hypothetical protein